MTRTACTARRPTPARYEDHDRFVIFEEPRARHHPHRCPAHRRSGPHPPGRPAHAGPAAAAGETITKPLQSALKALTVKDEDRTGYERTSFKHWVDADKHGCTTRAKVPKAEAVVAPDQGPKRKLSGGSWYSPYDDQYIEGPSTIDIDHRIPLAEAWDSGAKGWTAAERQEYANDLGDDRALIAVTAKSNRSKADQDPATWMPPGPMATGVST
ncbi:HNH endonuclease family protein [Streptomyces sp. NPDC059037]|uniref:HNH endonuclease family protein n=1 Tax=Streptomyces sp. NPDC059037 TaxID=3346710 RepID=UPI0036814234